MASGSRSLRMEQPPAQISYHLGICLVTSAPMAHRREGCGPHRGGRNDGIHLEGKRRREGNKATAAGGICAARLHGHGSSYDKLTNHPGKLNQHSEMYTCDSIFTHP